MWQENEQSTNNCYGEALSRTAELHLLIFNGLGVHGEEADKHKAVLKNTTTL